MNTQETINLPKRPDKLIDLKKEFNIQSNMQVKGFTSKTKWVPEIDHAYVLIKQPLSQFLLDSNTIEGSSSKVIMALVNQRILNKLQQD